jgi:hypothetical protein
MFSLLANKFFFTISQSPLLHQPQWRKRSVDLLMSSMTLLLQNLLKSRTQ